ncbi:MAG: cold shock domain-containing protein [Patescibacteria group bacterium]
MSSGTIARLTDRGYGFIKPEGGDKDVFFHAKDLQGLRYDDLREGDRVTFEITEGPKGPSAVNVAKA